MSDEPLTELQSNERSPEWLKKCLWQAHPVAFEETTFALGKAVSPEFLSRCASAASLGLQLAKLRNAAPASRAPMLPVVEYLQQLARSVSITLAPLGTWAGLDTPPTTATFASGWAKLATALGCDRREGLSRLRLSFLSVTQPDLLPIPAVLREAGSRRLATPDEIDVHLADAVACLTPVRQAELGRLELEFVRAFEATLES